jgi:hypothetical protein
MLGLIATLARRTQGARTAVCNRHVDDLEEIAGFVQHGDGAVSAEVNS